MIVTCAACGRKAAAIPETREVVCECGHVFDPAARPTVADPFLGHDVAGYRVEEVIGSGGMGTVYRATQLSLGRPVAFKVLPQHVADDPQFVERFHREAQVLASLGHPNIVSVFDRGEVDGRFFIVMEFVDGESLRALMKRGPLPPKQACRIISGLLGALDFAHSRGVVHRDIKPENVLVSHSGNVKVADFGLSRVLGDELQGRLTRTHLVLGTYEYMAPEQREATRDADPRADIYAAAVVLYEMLTGELPIGRFELPSVKAPHVDKRIDAIVDRALAKDPDRRYPRAGAMGDEIDALLSTPDAPVEIETLKQAAGRAFRRVRGMLRRNGPEPRPPCSYDLRLDLLLTILAVAGRIVTIGGIAVLFVGDGIVEANRGVLCIALLTYGSLLWNSAERARKFWPAARTSLLTLTLIGAPTVLMLPLAIWTWVLFLDRGMRIYYDARYRGVDAAQAAAAAQGLATPPAKPSRVPIVLAKLAVLFGLAAVLSLVAWGFIALDDSHKAFTDEGAAFFGVGALAGIVCLVLGRVASKEL